MLLRCVKTGFQGHGSKGPRGLGRPRDRDGVPPLSAAFGEEDVPVLADPVEVRTFGGRHAAPLPYRVVRFKEATGGEVDGRLADALTSAVKSSTCQVR